MAILDGLTEDIAMRFDLGLKARALVRDLSSFIAAQPGGIDGFLDKFRATGLEAKVASWLGGRSPMALSVREVKMALGDEVIEGIAEDTGVSEGFASGVLGYAIPKIIGLLTSGEAIPEEIPSGCIEISWLGTPVFGAARPGLFLRGREASSAARHGRRWPCRGAPFGCSRRGPAYYARIDRICHFIWYRGRSCIHPIRVQCCTKCTGSVPADALHAVIPRQ